jgi:hypothetical protein
LERGISIRTVEGKISPVITMRKSSRAPSVYSLAAGVVAAISILTLLARSQPVLNIAPYATNQLLLTVTNPAPSLMYELYTLPVLGNPNYSWTLCATGALGQSNWLINLGDQSSAFFKARSWDGTGVPPWMAADPNNPSLGPLSITIDSPLNGAVIQ